jgi:hypothetical protein
MLTWGASKRQKFEEWLEKFYPETWSEWELEASEWIELDEFLERHHYEILGEWEHYERYGHFTAECEER